MEREWKEGMEKEKGEREWNLAGGCVIGFRGIDADLPSLTHLA